MDQTQFEELLLQAMETELGGEQVYVAAVEAAVTDAVRDEWETYLAETRTHQEVLGEVFERLGLDPTMETPGRLIVRSKAAGLVRAIRTAMDEAPGALAELVAAECIVEAESKDHQNWVLIGLVAEASSGEVAAVLQEAFDEVFEQEAEHLFHTMGWARELWMASLGLPAAIPPPEEEKHTTTQIGAGRAAKARDEYVN